MQFSRPSADLASSSRVIAITTDSNAQRSMFACLVTPSRILHVRPTVLQLRLLHCNDKPDYSEIAATFSSVLNTSRGHSPLHRRDVDPRIVYD